MSNLYKEIEFRPTEKQHLLFQTFGNPDILEIAYGGSAGGGKSFGVWSLAIIKCIEHPGIRVGIARQTLTQIKNTTITTFYEVIKFFGLDNEYSYNQMKGEITFKNGSVIQFFELRYLPQDPDYARIGGALLTFGIIEEAGGVDYRGVEIFSSRLGRWKNDEYNIPPHLFLTTNPSTNFMYSDFYIPYINNELPNHRMYIPATIKDNKYINSNYAKALETRLGESQAKRLLDGLWDFDDDDTRLMKYKTINEIFDNVDDPTPDETEYLTADIAFTSDRTIIIHWIGYTIETITYYKGNEPEVELNRLAEKLNINQHNIAYDSDGVGKYIKGKLPRAKAIINNGRPIGNQNYYNLKTQLNFKMAEMINNNLIKCRDTSMRDDMVQELYEVRTKPLEEIDGKLKLISKKEVKAIIGRSPDIADAISFRTIFELKEERSKTPTIRFAVNR